MLLCKWIAVYGPSSGIHDLQPEIESNTCELGSEAKTCAQAEKKYMHKNNILKGTKAEVLNNFSMKIN